MVDPAIILTLKQLFATYLGVPVSKINLAFLPATVGRLLATTDKTTVQVTVTTDNAAEADRAFFALSDRTAVNSVLASPALSSAIITANPGIGAFSVDPVTTTPVVADRSGTVLANPVASNDDNTKRNAAIIGGVIGGFFGLLFIILGTWYFCKSPKAVKTGGATESV